MTTPEHHTNRSPSGDFTLINGEPYYRISGYDNMPPFFMSLASDTDLWMFVSSTGGLTAGRVDADGALFPYETVDKLHDGYLHTGPVTLIRATGKSGRAQLWQPFSGAAPGAGGIERNLNKNTEGNRLVFEEINHELGLRAAYRWSGCDRFGLVRTTTISNVGPKPATIDVLDGLRNVLPYGAPLALYRQSSSLVDAYKRTDCDPDTHMAVYSLTAKIIDRPEAAEVLRANVVWCTGLTDYRVGLSAGSVETFRAGGTIEDEKILTGRRGNYFVVSSFDLGPGDSRKWHIAADVGKSHVGLAELDTRLREDKQIHRAIDTALDAATENLRRNVASADGVQATGSKAASAHHFANVLFNNMRGGVFADNHSIPTADLRQFIRDRNRGVADRHEKQLEGLPADVPVCDLHNITAGTGEADFQRLCLEYLPIYFSRRHGDPSRPWNQFSIRLKNADGSRALRYEGNWRDIFQNWEALAVSFPDFLPGLIAKFVNASTIDGFNPYRLTSDGVDWETIDPDDPWSYIGYWGDHQIVYLLKFLEAQERLSAENLEAMLDRDIFSYADVPYRIKPYESIVADPHDTIEFDPALDAAVKDRHNSVGADGRLVVDKNGSVYRVTLLEKLLVPALCKLSNMVPGGGVWMNTQRPEWNDANNALVGNGLSMVTLCYLRRYLDFLRSFLGRAGNRKAAVSTEVALWFDRIRSTLESAKPMLDAPEIDDTDRKRLLDELGRAFSDYRKQVYQNGFSGRRDVATADVVALCGCAIAHIDCTIRANRRADGLYHSYNLLRISGDGTQAAVGHLPEMLEGQVAALSSGLVEAEEAVAVIEALFDSRLYRDDQRSFLLYPEKKLPAFIDKNVIPEKTIRSVPLFKELLDAGDTSIVSRDIAGAVRFNGDFETGREVDRALDSLSQQDRWAAAVKRDRALVLAVFSAVFGHDTYTGRSGAMYGYEGLGCIYWHMVAKLLVAVQEITLRASGDAKQKSAFDELSRLYYRIRSGLGFEKTAAEYGAFPTDPYSHTPPHAGAQQPGMTGQVKEEILTRFGELGVIIEDGCVVFRPVLLKPEEFLDSPDRLRSYDINGNPLSIDLPAGTLAFSLCGTPIVYHSAGDRSWIRITDTAGKQSEQAGDRLDKITSRSLLGRTGEVSRIEVGIPDSELCRLQGN